MGGVSIKYLSAVSALQKTAYFGLRLFLQIQLCFAIKNHSMVGLDVLICVIGGHRDNSH